MPCEAFLVAVRLITAISSNVWFVVEPLASSVSATGALAIVNVWLVVALKFPAVSLA